MPKRRDGQRKTKVGEDWQAQGWGDSYHAGKEASIDAHASRDWQHPADAMDAPSVAPALAAEDATMFRALIELVVPPAHYGRMRRWEAGHHRLVVMVYVIAPEYFPGMTREDLGKALGLCPRALAKQFAAVHDALASAAKRRANPAP